MNADKPNMLHLRSSAANFLCTITLENERTVGPSEAEAVREGVLDGHGTGFIWHVVEVAKRIGVFVVDGGRGDLVANGQHRNAGFQSARAAEQMTGHRLG